jgi:hypothetical protein
MKRGCLVATVALWTSLLVTESLAVLLAPQYSGYLEINNGPQQQALEVWSDGTNRSISLSGSTASISNDYNFPYLSASASVAAGMNATAISTLLYGVRFTGPGDEVAVSILSSGRSRRYWARDPFTFKFPDSESTVRSTRWCFLQIAIFVRAIVSR